MDSQEKIFKWIELVLTEFCSIHNNVFVSIEPNMKIIDFITRANWDDWDWILFLMTIEIKYGISIPENFSVDEKLTFNGFTSMLSQQSNETTEIYLLEHIRAIGYLNLNKNYPTIISSLIYAES